MFEIIFVEWAFTARRKKAWRGKMPSRFYYVCWFVFIFYHQLTFKWKCWLDNQELFAAYYKMSNSRVKITQLCKYELIVMKCQALRQKKPLYETIWDNLMLSRIVFCFIFLFLPKMTLYVVVQYQANIFSPLGLLFPRERHFNSLFGVKHITVNMNGIFLLYCVQEVLEPVSCSMRTATLPDATTSSSISSATQAAQDTKSSASGPTTSGSTWVHFLTHTHYHSSSIPL